MARCARYGNVQPSEFDRMDWQESMELAKRVTDMHEADQELIIELGKAQIKASGAGVRLM